MTYPEQERPQAPYSISGEQSTWKPVVTYALIGITVAVYLLQMGSQFLLGGDYPASIGMKVNGLIVQGQLWRLITPVFLHANLLHIGFNMYALLVIGPGIERYYGRGRYLALYFLSGFAGNVGSFLFSGAPSLGASTAIFGLLGAEGVFIYQNRELLGSRAQRALINVVMIAVINLLIGLTPGIDNWGHMGGLIGGVLFAWFAGPKFQRQDLAYMQVPRDERGSREAITTGILVGFLFAVLAGLKIFLGVP